MISEIEHCRREAAKIRAVMSNFTDAQLLAQIEAAASRFEARADMLAAEIRRKHAAGG